MEFTGGGESGQPTNFGKYSLFAKLGRGGMADVFLAVARGPMGFNKLTVIKRLKPMLAEEASFRDMFIDEARLAARLNHPNIVQTFEVGEHEGSYFIAMEYLEGQPLNLVQKEAGKAGKALSPALSVRIVSDMLQALHYAHKLQDYDGSPLKIVHRDVSPHNVFITYDGQIKLVDFGIAKAVLSSSQTDVGVLKGKVAYMAPEQARGEPLDARADVFAAGIVLWELLTSRRLYTGESTAILHRLLYAPVPRVREAAPHIDERLDEIVARALEQDRDKRYQSAAELRNALEAWLASQPRGAHSEELGVLVDDLFHSTREEVRRQIKLHMGAVASSDSSQMVSLDRISGGVPKTTGSLPTLNLGDESSWSGGGNSGDSGSEPKPNSVSKVAAVAASVPASTPPPRPQPRSKAPVVGLLLAGLLGAVAVVRLSQPTPPPPSPQVAAAPTATTTATTTTTTTATAEPARTAVAPPASTAAPDATATATATATTTATTATAIAHVGPRPPGPLKPGKPGPPAATTTEAPAATTAPPPAEGPGFLTLDTYPWTRVSEGGRVLGTTPLIRVPMPPGPHSLMLENPEQGIKQSYSVVIKSGETASRRLGLKLNDSPG